MVVSTKFLVLLGLGDVRAGEASGGLSAAVKLLLLLPNELDERSSSLPSGTIGSGGGEIPNEVDFDDRLL